jgi:anti-anti-sigma factor
MNIVFDDSSGTFILRVSGDMRIWGRREAETLRLVNLVRAQEKLPRGVILNLAEIKQIDSLGVGALARLLVECAKQEIALNVVLPTGIPGKVLKLVHIFDAWPAFPDETAAVQASLRTADTG